MGRVGAHALRFKTIALEDVKYMQRIPILYKKPTIIKGLHSPTKKSPDKSTGACVSIKPNLNYTCI